MFSILLHPFSQAYHHSATLFLISKIFCFIIISSSISPPTYSLVFTASQQKKHHQFPFFCCPLLSTCSFSRLLKYSHKVRLSASIYDPVQHLLDRVRATRQHLPSSSLLIHCIFDRCDRQTLHRNGIPTEQAMQARQMHWNHFTALMNQAHLRKGFKIASRSSQWVSLLHEWTLGHLLLVASSLCWLSCLHL